METLPRALFTDIERHLAALLARLASEAGAAPDAADAVGFAGALAGLRAREGHTAFRPGHEGGRVLSGVEADGSPVSVVLPAAAEWLARLRAVPSVVGPPGSDLPLILDAEGRIGLHRLERAEAAVALGLRARAVDLGVDAGPAWDLPGALKRYFPECGGAETHWQAVAAFAALRSRCLFLSGGPGTGKTHSVVYLLALRLEQAFPTPLRIAVCAPTGKAAARLEESMARTRERLPCVEAVRDALPRTVRTIHRLLGASADGTRFRHGPESPVEADVVVVDEASMVDVVLMRRLLEALRPECQLVLVGDPDQLPSVDPGAVLGDLCPPDRVSRFPKAFADAWESATGNRLPADAVEADPARLADPFLGRRVGLVRNRRFAEGGGLHELAAAVRAGRVPEEREGSAAAAFVRSGLPPAGRLRAALRGPVLDGWRGLFGAKEGASAFRAMERFRILCAVREGPQGVESLNEAVRDILEAEGLARRGGVFAGLQVMVTVNDPSIGVSNGDLGLYWPGEDGLEVLFQGGALRLSPARLPAHETAFALTVHKSQGSEFDRVLMVLPSPGPGPAAEAGFWDGAGRLLTRELVYTGITRARESVEVWAREGVLERAVATRSRRETRLGGLLG